MEARNEYECRNESAEKQKAAIQEYIEENRDDILDDLFRYDTGWAVYIWEDEDGKIEHCAHQKSQTQIGVKYLAHVSDCGWDETDGNGDGFDEDGDNYDFFEWLSNYNRFPSCLEGKITLYLDGIFAPEPEDEDEDE